MDDSQLYDVNIETITPSPSPNKLIERLPVSEKAYDTVLKGREGIVNILNAKDKRFLAFVGPCSIHDVRAALEYAHLLKELAAEVSRRIFIVMRVYFDKPRTTIGWKGFISDPNLDGSLRMAEGTERARELLLRITEMGLPTATEFVNPIIPQYLADLVCWNAIGARTVESQTHREVASGLSMPVGCKNGTGGNSYSIKIAVDAITTIRHPHSFPSINRDGIGAEVHTTGNPWGHLVLRGGEAGTNYDKKSVAHAQEALLKANVCPRLLVDCSHGNCKKQHELQAVAFFDVLRQRVAGNRNIAGIMLESNIREGNQKHDPQTQDPSRLIYGVSITDPCISWSESKKLLKEAYRMLSK